ncbi:MAG TPA: tetratricopeptide repeat protein [Candidatus Absconditabacterales bacterium]|nr:tetratricopeptide repeat protein [Candidatus Absconditabacterales bacterium]
MADYIPDSLIKEVEELKKIEKFDEAMRIINSILSKNPNNEDALLQVADIQYRQGEIGKATKAIDFLNSKKNNEDPLGLYIKGILEMEKNHRKNAKGYLQEALVLTNAENHEIMRCYGLCEYRYGNREKGIDLLKDSFSLNDKDAEVIFNLIEIYILEHKYEKARNMIKYYYKNHKELVTIDKEIEHYDNKISLFEEFVKTQLVFK